MEPDGHGLHLLRANQCVSVSLRDRNWLCPEAFHMVTEANLLVLLRLNQPFLIANTELLKVSESRVVR